MIGEAGSVRTGARTVGCCIAISLGFSAGCGYRPAYGGAPGQRLHVTVVRTLVADAVASDEIASGVRDELARAGALAPGDGYPRVEIEVLRAGERSEGISRGATSASTPAARATDVGIRGRAWIVWAKGERPENDTGDLEAETAIAVDATLEARDPRASTFHHADALRSAARRLGRNLARRVMGGAAISDGTD